MSRRGTIVIHPTGNENVRQCLTALADAQQMRKFVTTLGFRDGPSWPALPKSVREQLARRSYPQLGEGQLSTSPLSEAARLVLTRARNPRLAGLAGHNSFLGPNANARRLDRHAAKRLNGADSILGWGGYSLQTLRAAQDQGIPTILEMPFAYYKYARDIMKIEAKKNPEYAVTMTQLTDQPWLDAIRDEEIELADALLVPSQQVAKGLVDRGVSSKVHFAPYGCPPVQDDERPRRMERKRPLRALFVGRLQADKGIAYLNEAIELTEDDVHWSVIGQRPSVDCPALDRMLARIDYMGTMSREQVLAQMRIADVLVLPSLVEGRSLSVLEAMSTGLSVIISSGTGAEDMLDDHDAGRTIPAGDGQAIAKALYELIDDTGGIERRSVAALAAAGAHGWDAYRSAVVKVVQDTVTASL